MKKQRMFVGLAAALGLVLAACGANNDDAGTATPGGTDNNGGEVSAQDEGFVDGRFTETRHISVALWDRGNERIPNFNESYWAQWVADTILEEKNIAVEWVTVGRWSEIDDQTTMLGAQSAPDIGYTFSQPMVETMAGMGGMINLTPLLEEYRALLPNLFETVGDELIFWNQDPDTDELFSITGRNNQHGRVNTFIREDWLEILDIPVPTNLEEFEAALEAFRDNAPQLPGNDNGSVIPFFTSRDVMWDAQPLIESLIPSDLSEREWFVYGFDDRRFMFEDAAREATRVLNRWYNNDLVWRDFAIAEPTVGHDLIRQGNVGAFMANWDMPFRAGDRWTTDMRLNTNEDANFLPINTFLNDAGEYQKFFPMPTDRFIFLPVTNDEPLASLLYIDFMSRPDVIEFLQFGIEGTHRETQADGSFIVLSENDDHQWPDNQVIPSANNFDITLTVNGVASLDVLGRAYPGITPEQVMHSRAIGMDVARRFYPVSVRSRASEEGMSEPLRDFRDQMLARLVSNTSIENFDAEWAREYEMYMALGARAIIEERQEAWVETFGDVDNLER